MRIAAISDIHGDLRALEAAWRDIEERGLAEEPVLNAGDTVAYGPDAMACIDFVRDPRHRIISVAGNYDVNSARFPAKERSFRQKWAGLRPAKFQALKDASESLTDEARDWLFQLPAIQTVKIESHTISLSHYAPTEGKEGLFEDTPEARLRQIAIEIGSGIDICVTGHSHSAFVRTAGPILFVNPGSVGRSFGMPSYAEVTIDAESPPTGRIVTCRVMQP